MPVAPVPSSARSLRVPRPLWAEADRVAREVGYRDVEAYIADALGRLIERGDAPWTD